MNRCDVDSLQAQVRFEVRAQTLIVVLIVRAAAEQVFQKRCMQVVLISTDRVRHAHGRHVPLGVVDPPRTAGRPLRIVHVERDRVRLDQASHLRVREQRVVDCDVRLLELLDRVAGARVEQVVALAVVRSQVRAEVVGAEEPIEAGQLAHLFVRERLALLLAELDRAHGVPLLVRDRE